jgi:hypothetical protein
MPGIRQHAAKTYAGSNRPIDLCGLGPRRSIFGPDTRSLQPSLIARPALGEEEPQRQHHRHFAARMRQRYYGLPAIWRAFASPNSLFNLSKLSVWWLRLGIEVERIRPSHPQQNGRHERMHLRLKLETTKPAGKNFLQQQARFDDFVECYNNERPHQALNMRCPPEC